MPARRSWRAIGGRWSCWTRSAAIRCGCSRRRRRRDGWRWRLRRRPTRCCRCWRPGRGCGCSSTPESARIGAGSVGTGGFGCRSAPTRRGWSGGWRSTGCGGSASIRALMRSRSMRWRRSRPRPGRSRCRSTGRRSSWLWSLDGYPSDPAHAQFAGKSLRGVRIWRVGGGGLRPGGRRGGGAPPGGGVPRRGRRPPARVLRGPRPPRPARLRDRHRADRALVVGGAGLAAGGAGRRRGGGRAPARRCPQALAEHEPVERPLAASTWGEDKDLRTWDSPPVADLAWGARRLELRLLRALSNGLRGAGRAARGARAARGPGQRLGLSRQARPGGRLRLPACHRRTPEAMLEAIDSPASTDPRMRALAPDLSLSPLLQP